MGVLGGVGAKGENWDNNPQQELFDMLLNQMLERVVSQSSKKQQRTGEDPITSRGKHIF